MIYFKAQGRAACCKTDEPITTGSVGLPAVFDFDTAWDGLTKTAVFTGSGESIDQIIGADNTLAVPWECLQSAGGTLIIGVRGALEDGTVVVPTVLARAGVIERGTAISGVSPSDPTPSWADEVKAQAAEALERAQVFPAGGTTGQVLTKQSGTDFDADWEDPTGGGGTADIDLGITGASVGQHAAVAAVDGEGKPTSWRAETPPQPWDGSSTGGTEPAVGAVTSVNGQTGAVVLDAEDVGAYEKPASGIPKADLAAGVQASLDKADTALQQHQSLAAYRTAADQDDIDTAQDTAIAGKQAKITASGILKGDGSGGVSAATAGTDYATPSQIPQPWDGSSTGGSAPSGGAVASVNGKTGVVVLDASDVGAVDAGDYNPEAKTNAMTQAVGVDANGKLWTIPGSGGAAVTSVNGQTGTVVLGASDVGALPDDTAIPAKVSDLTNDSGFVNASGAAAVAPVQSVNGQTGAVTVPVVTVDSALSDSSTNPVQNKIIKTALDGKGTYSKPSTGIPASDLAQAVQTSLGKADTALQSVPSTYRTAAAQDDIDDAQDAAIAGKQAKINASGILKGDGSGGVSAATAGTDYATPAQVNAKYTKPSTGIPASDLASGVIPSVPSAYTSNPAMDGTASPGSSTSWARGDHVHPRDTTRAPLASPAFTGTPTAPTAPSGTSSTQIATTAFVAAALGETVSVSGTTPTINAVANNRYVCGTVSTISITPPTSGICDVVFKNGSTPAVLTVPSTVKWANNFSPSSLVANTTVELNFLDGLGVAASWT